MGKTIAINPPPKDMKCMSCGTPSSELKAFGKAGDPLVGDFSGSKLVKTFRELVPAHKEFDGLGNDALSAAEGDYNRYEECLVAMVGREKTDQIFMYEQAHGTVGAFWECRNCIIKD